MEMLSPTHIQVTVQRAKNLRTKGRAATNDAFVLIQMGKEKFQTSVKEKCIDPEWYEECDLTFLMYDMSIVLVVFHRNLIGIDEFLGEVTIPLQQFEYLDRPTNRWYPLGGRAGKKDGKNRGELEVCIASVVRIADTQSLNEFAVSKKQKNSLKGIATSVTHKLQKFPSRSLSLRTENFDPKRRLSKLWEKKNSLPNNEDIHSTSPNSEENNSMPHDANIGSAPIRPSRKLSSVYSSTISLPQSAMITSSIQEDKSLEDEVNAKNNEFIQRDEKIYSDDVSDIKVVNTKFRRNYDAVDEYDGKSQIHGEWVQRISSRMKDLTRSEMNLSDMNRNEIASVREKRSTLESLKSTLRRHTLQFVESSDVASLKMFGSPRKIQLDLKKSNNNNQDVKDNMRLSNEVPCEVMKQYETMNQQDLITLAVYQQIEIEKLQGKIVDMENYLDNLLVRVMETTPKILQIPYGSLTRAFSK